MGVRDAERFRFHALHVPGQEGQGGGFPRVSPEALATLDRAGLVSAERPRIWKGTEKSGTVTFIETFEWKDARSPEVAHQNPEVMAVWEPMGTHAEEMHFLQVEPVL